MDFIGPFFLTLAFTLAETAPYVLLGYFIAAIIREFLPQEFLARWLGPHGIAPLLKALGIGSILPICSCGVVPLSVGLVRCGAAQGTVLSFMATAPALSPVSVILGLSLLGAPFMGAYIGLVLLGAFLMGLIGNRFLPVGRGLDAQRKTGFQHKEQLLTPEDRRIPLSTRIRRAAHWGFFDLGTEVSLDLLFGLTLATLVSLLVPASWIASWLGGAGILSLFFIVLLSLPIYTCSVPSLPVVQKLLLLGASPGVAFAYLVAGPATNLGELTVIRRSMGLRTTLYYTASLILLSIGGGLLINAWLLDPESSRMIGLGAKQMGEHLKAIAKWSDFQLLLNDMGWLTIASTLLVFSIIAWGSVQKIRLLYTDPCKHCHFWNDVSKTAACPGRCWLKSTQLKVRKIIGK